LLDAGFLLQYRRSAFAYDPLVPAFFGSSYFGVVWQLAASPHDFREVWPCCTLVSDFLDNPQSFAEDNLELVATLLAHLALVAPYTAYVARPPNRVDGEGVAALVVAVQCEGNRDRYDS
jgi:hypothetical protein